MRQEDINKRLSDVPLFKELSDKDTRAGIIL
jgi:hypothetical protein